MARRRAAPAEKAKKSPKEFDKFESERLDFLNCRCFPKGFKLNWTNYQRLTPKFSGMEAHSTSFETENDDR